MEDTAFDRFLIRHHRDLQRIARHTRGEESLESVQSEAWMMVLELSERGMPVDLDVPEHAGKVVAHVYQKLVRYTELHIRHAVRLDHAIDGTDDGAAHPLMHRLAADEQYEPTVALARREREAAAPSDDLLNPHRSLAGAYLELLGRFRNHMPDVARHLMISVSYCYRRCAHARVLATWQHGLPSGCVCADTAFVPGPWRRFRVVRVPEQLCFAFGDPEALFDTHEQGKEVPATGERESCAARPAGQRRRRPGRIIRPCQRGRA